MKLLMSMKQLFSLIALLLLSASINAQTASVISENANLLGTASESGKVVAILKAGTETEILKQNGSWFLVQSTDYAGWLHIDTIKVYGPATISIIDEAEIKRLTPVRSVIIAPKIVPQTMAPASVPRTDTGSSRYIRGSRGGCYYLNSKGNKTYVDRSLCS
ncbi:MAG: hypothetical protein M3Q26_07230 [Acidobacteriota bacterium]|nr:hypothetical protein [Acidobacteriota bacterium]